MPIIQAFKTFLKRFFPPPTKSFIREINDIRQHLLSIEETNRQQMQELVYLRIENAKQAEELNKVSGESKKLLNELTRLRNERKEELAALNKSYENHEKLLDRMANLSKENIEKQTEFEESIRGGLQKIQNQTQVCINKAAESVWAEVFNNTISGSAWLKDQAFSPGRWALGYQALYVLYRILDNVKPKRILELGLGQSTNMITQYAMTDNAVKHFVVEHDPEWIRFYKKEYPLAAQTEVVHLDKTFIPYKEAEAVRVFANFADAFAGKKFDLIVIDAPLGGDMKKYARIDILGLLPDCLCEDFAILVDDTQRPGEANTIKEIVACLDAAGVDYAKGNYSGEKSCAVICSQNNAFLASL